MLLAIDIGNTNTVAGVFENDKLVDYFRITSGHTLTVDECGFFITGLLDRLNINVEQIDRVAIASVVPGLTLIYEKMIQKYIKVEPLIVTSNLKLPIEIAYDDPGAVGADRIANSVAAYTKFGGPIIIVDFGTATTFDVVSEKGIYLGGIIAPGPETSGAELAKQAARLFSVRIEKPDNIIGRNTAESIKSGLFYGTIGQIDTIIKLISEELGVEPRVIATGGLATEFESSSYYIKSTYPSLTLEGIKIIADHQP